MVRGGCCSSTRPPARRDPGEYQLGLSYDELPYAVNQSESRMLFAVPTSKTSDYRFTTDEVRHELPLLERAANLSFDDPINI